MEVTLLYFDDCPSWRVANQRLELVELELPDVHLTRRRVATPEDAERLGFCGSPSIMVDGRDLLPGTGAQVGLTCRVYETPEGRSGSPTLEQLRAALSAVSRG